MFSIIILYWKGKCLALCKKTPPDFCSSNLQSRLCCFIAMSAIVTLVEMEATWKWNETNPPGDLESRIIHCYYTSCRCFCLGMYLDFENATISIGPHSFEIMPSCKLSLTHVLFFQILSAFMAAMAVSTWSLSQRWGFPKTSSQVLNRPLFALCLASISCSFSSGQPLSNTT